ncbi:MAG: glycosyltransferase family 1 protein [bacterium]|nr:glycosyltransferase family 1 protein [bacterium]MDZ4285029.1 glycosyltransferase family 1 protein [Patescibacteria group bacterium]
MKIGIILHPYGEREPAGLARTIFELTRGMLEVDQENEYLIFTKHAPAALPDLPGRNWCLVPLIERDAGFLSRALWLNRLRRAAQADVYLFNTPVLPLLWKPRRSVVLALDFAYLRLPPENMRQWISKYLTRAYHAYSLSRADRVVAISEATKRDTVVLFGTRAEHIAVVLCGFKKVCDAEEVPRDVHAPFFLCVGVVKQRKNTLAVVEAFAEYCERGGEGTLVLGGRMQGVYAERVRRTIHERGVTNRVQILGHLNDGELSFLYRRARALVFPSLIEGFGYPILEAMHCGLSVITSNGSSLAEVAGDAALLVDPRDPHALASAMLRLACEPALRAELAARGRVRAAEFSWRKAGREMLAILEHMVG